MVSILIKLHVYSVPPLHETVTVTVGFYNKPQTILSALFIACTHL